MDKEIKLDDILIAGQQYIVWGKHNVIYRFKDKRTHIFELPDGSLTKFTNLKVNDVKLLNGQTPKTVSNSKTIKSVKATSDILYKPVNTGDFMKDMETNFANLKKIDQKVKAQDGILGRYIQEPYADGYAVYQVVEEKATKFKLKVVGGIGDDWVLPMWGREAMVDKGYVQTSIYRRDKMEELFRRR